MKGQRSKRARRVEASADRGLRLPHAKTIIPARAVASPLHQSISLSSNAITTSDGIFVTVERYGGKGSGTFMLTLGANKQSSTVSRLMLLWAEEALEAIGTVHEAQQPLNPRLQLLQPFAGLFCHRISWAPDLRASDHPTLWFQTMSGCTERQ